MMKEKRKMSIWSHRKSKLTHADVTQKKKKKRSVVIIRENRGK